VSVTDKDRRELFDGLVSVLGEVRAGVLMELLPPVGWGDVARRGDLAELRGEMAELRVDLRGEMAELRGEMAELRVELKGEIAAVRSQLPKLIAANIASMIGVAGLVLAAGAVL
jgi:hypothetical protein